MFAFALSLLALCSVAGLLQFWSSRRWLSKSSLLCSAAFAAIVAALCLQGVTALVTAFGIANPDASFMGYFNQTGYITIAGAIVAVLLPAVVGVVIAFIPAALTAALLRPTAAQ